MQHFKRGIEPAKAMGIGVFHKRVTKVERKTFVKNKLATSKIWAEKALLKIYDAQTDDEQTWKTTSDFNNVGFTGCDAEILSSFAEGLKNIKG